MANDNDRGARLYEIAAEIHAGAVVDPLQAAHDIRKYVQLVVDRDIGPTNEVRAENTRLRSELAIATSLNESLRQQLEEMKKLRNEVIRLQRANDGLRETGETMRKKIVELSK